MIKTLNKYDYDQILRENNKLRENLSASEKIFEEYEAKVCELEYNLELSKKNNNDLVEYYQKKLDILENEKNLLKHEIQSKNEEYLDLSRDFSGLKDRYKIANDYIKTLPTPQATDRMERNISQLSKQLQICTENLSKQDRKILDLEKTLCSKNMEIGQLYDKEKEFLNDIRMWKDRFNRSQLENMKISEDEKNENCKDDLILEIENYKSQLLYQKKLLENEKIRFQKEKEKLLIEIDNLTYKLDNEVKSNDVLVKENDAKFQHCYHLEDKIVELNRIINQLQEQLLDQEAQLSSSNDNTVNFDRTQTELIAMLDNCSQQIKLMTRFYCELKKTKEPNLQLILDCKALDSSVSLRLFGNNDRNTTSDLIQILKGIRSIINECTTDLTELISNETAIGISHCIQQ